ncbi:SDR family NAD(P)-dependent oxidoreductase [Nesterenkonia sp. HG001]|uniref:SDR family NAD(P)-dependent oxidoreductase n=1 Tax=Nesterenkonia sp. HG001 TaxID=2983207 RepID=UPI002AC70D8D|nr:SDR family NAD(P)-dependent oxidoreductase [Nesterenkonia sp. HG001]MDZ5077549.1 SDR family NAD(P)-dependent oxidoreductase [Nesterenkonia sp. HG001]
MSTHTALITGSTSGLGASFARQLAAQGYDLVLVARDGDRLQAQAESLTSQYGVRTTVLVADLVTEDGVGAVQERLTDARHPVHLLVNNAGHGLPTDFVESELDAERDLLRLHVQTTMELTHTAARAMRRRRAGRIINVASVAGFTPTGTYSAAKAWVINFTKSVHQQLRGDGITVTALCPGLVRTEFHERSGIKVKGAKRWMWLDAEDVVREGLTASAQGASMCVPSRSYQMLTASLKFVPDTMVRWAMERRVGVPPEGEAMAQLESGGGRRHGGDGTAEPTSEATRTVDAYKAAKAQDSRGRDAAAPRSSETEAAGPEAEGPETASSETATSEVPTTPTSTVRAETSTTHGEPEPSGSMRLNGRNPLKK